MMIALVTFATPNMSVSADRCARSAIAMGADCAMAFNEAQVELLAHPLPALRALMKQPRGVGYWAWKPFVIAEMMKTLHDGDLILYADAGIEFLEPVQTVIDKMDQDIYLFGNQHLHAHWCKRDIIEAVWPLDVQKEFDGAGQPHIMDWHRPTWDRFTTQAQASVIFFRVNDYTRKFVKEWLDWCLFEDGRLIDDSPSRTPNHPEFKENRHDQAILTTMAYREGIKLHEWYVEYETYTPVHLREYEQEFEKPLFLHHRFRNSDWEARGVAA